MNPTPTQTPIGSAECRALLGSMLRPGGGPVSLSTLHRMREQGLPHTKFRRLVSYDREQVIAWIQRFRRGVFLVGNQRNFSSPGAGVCGAETRTRTLGASTPNATTSALHARVVAGATFNR